jgi:hypothetical protein
MQDKRPNIVNEFVIAHTSHIEATSRIEKCLAGWAPDSENKAVAVVGESGVGKSFAMRCVLSKHEPYETQDGWEVPILWATLPPRPTTKTLAGVLLAGLKDPTWDRGTENQMSKRLRILMRETKTRMVMLNEFQHFLDSKNDRVIYDVADWLKVLVEDTRSILVVAGLPSCTAIINSNEQLRGRFQAPIHLSRFSWQDIRQRKEFRGILMTFYSTLSECYELPELHTEDMAFRFYCATGGLMDILRQAVENADEKNEKMILLRDLHLAHTQAIWQSPLGADKAVHPFDRGFIPTETIELLDSAARVGMVVPRPSSSLKKPSQRAQTRSLHDTLVTR